MPKDKIILNGPEDAELLAAVFDSTEAVRFIVSRDGTILYFNRKAFENASLLHGKTLKKGDNLFSYASDPGKEVESELKKDYERAFAGETFLKEAEISYNSESRWFQTEYVPILSKLKIIAVSINIYEITERKLTEQSKDALILEQKSVIQNLLKERAQVWKKIGKCFSEIISRTARESNKDIKEELSTLYSNILEIRKG
ncbi:MAG: PAS domain-containing protein [Bacteroidota bacterium]